MCVCVCVCVYVWRGSLGLYGEVRTFEVGIKCKQGVQAKSMSTVLFISML